MRLGGVGFLVDGVELADELAVEGLASNEAVESFRGAAFFLAGTPSGQVH